MEGLCTEEGLCRPSTTPVGTTDEIVYCHVGLVVFVWMKKTVSCYN